MVGSGHVHATQDDPVAAGLSEVVGGPVGSRAGRSPWWSPVRVLLLMVAVTMAAGMVQKAPCSLVQGKDQNWTYSHMCYSDLKPLYVPRGMVEHAWPYSGDAQTRSRYEVMEYPVGISYWAWGTAWVTHALTGFPDTAARGDQPVSALYGDPDVKRETTVYLLVNAIGFALLAMLSVWLLSRTNPRRPWDAAAFALSPALLLTGLINWDLLAVALVAGALWAWSRDRPILTGVLIGLGTAAKLYPLFLLGAVLVLCLRNRRLMAFAWCTVAAVGAWLVANAPAWLSGAEQWKVFWSFNSDRTADLGSLWMLISQASDKDITAHTINLWSWALFGLWCVAVWVLGMLAPRRRLEASGVDHVRLAQLGYLIVVGFLVVNKVYSPQYVLWLLPLAVLARPRWREQLVWQGTEIFYFCTVWWYLGGFLAPAGGGDAGFYWIGICVRVAGELFLAGVIIRDIFRPERDPVAVTEGETAQRPAPGRHQLALS